MAECVYMEPCYHFLLSLLIVTVASS
jgi:hypothetical protein